MGSDVATKIIAAIAGVLVAELTDKALGWAGMPEEFAKLPRAIIKAVAGSATAFLTEEILSNSDPGAPLNGDAD